MRIKNLRLVRPHGSASWPHFRALSLALVAMLAAVMAWVPVAPQAEALDDSGNYKCTPGVSYTIESNGRVYEINETSVGFASNSTPVMQFQGTSVNGLAIGAGGSTAFAYERYANNIRIYQWNAGSSTNMTAYTQVPISNVRGETFRGDWMIGGAANLDNGVVRPGFNGG